MLRPLALVTIVALLIALGWLLLDRTASPPVPAVPTKLPGNTATNAAARLAANHATAAERSSAPVTQAGNDDNHLHDGAPTFSVHGRCVVANGGTPLQQCSIQVRIESGTDARQQPWQDKEVEQTSDTDGAFACDVHHDDWTDTVAVRIYKDGYVPRIARWQQPAPGSNIDLGDVPMLRAIPIAGMVVDQAGLAVEGAGMLFVYIPLTSKHVAEADSFLRTRSDAAGRFSFDAPAHAGEWYIGAEDTGALVEPRSVKLTTETAFELRVIVERPDPVHNITGTVVDPSGRPLAGMTISASGEGFIGRGRSNAEGRFTVQRAGPIPDDGKGGTLLSIRDPNTRYERIRPSKDERVAWGKHGLEVVMRERAGRTVRVIDESGNPVEAYTLFALRGKSRLALLKTTTQRGIHKEGRCRLQSLQVGPHAVVVVPRDRNYASTSAIAFEVVPLAEPAELLVTVLRPVQTTIKVVNGAGHAIDDSTVELLQSFDTETPTATTIAATLRNCDQGRAPSSHVLIATAATDASGTATLQAPPGAWHIRVTGPSHVPHVQAIVIAKPSSHVQVAVQPAATLFGSVQPAEALARLRELSSSGKEQVAVIVKPQGKKALPPVAVAEDGSFSLGGLSAGLHNVSLRYWLNTSPVRADNVTMAIADVPLQVGQRSKLTIDAAVLLPGTVQGRIVAGGIPLGDVHCFLRRIGPGPFLNLRIATDSDGRFTGLVPAGQYGFSMTYPAQPGPGWLSIVLPEEWHLAPGQSHTINFDVPLRRIRLRVLGGDQLPHAGLRVKIVRKGYFLPGGLKTDSSGEVEIFPAPLDAFHIEITVDGKKQQLGPLDLPTGETTGTIVTHSNEPG